jgi:hypothetical protein
MVFGEFFCTFTAFLHSFFSSWLCNLLFCSCVPCRLPASWNYSAIERVLRGAHARGDRSIFELEEGKVFDSPQEGFQFFNMYSWELGFGIRFGRSRSNISSRRTRQDIMCACEVSLPDSCSSVSLQFFPFFILGSLFSFDFFNIFCRVAMGVRMPSLFVADVLL